MSFEKSEDYLLVTESSVESERAGTVPQDLAANIMLTWAEKAKARTAGPMFVWLAISRREL